MTRLIIWRHGNTEWNATDRVQGQLDTPLNDLGREQAAAAAPLLAALEPDAIVASDLTLQLLGTLATRWLGDTDGTQVLTLISGLTGNRTVETNHALWLLAERARRHPALADLVRRGTPTPAQLEATDGGPEFADELALFLHDYGHRSPRYEFSHPTWPMWRKLYSEYLMGAIPSVARHVASNPDAYVYLAESIQAWPAQAELAGMIGAAGWTGVQVKNLTGGIVALHIATNPG